MPVSFIANLKKFCRTILYYDIPTMWNIYYLVYYIMLPRGKTQEAIHAEHGHPRAVRATLCNTTLCNTRGIKSTAQ